MSEFIKQKQVQGLVADLAARALDNEVVKKANNLSDVTANTARTNLDVYSKSEVQSLVAGADNAHSVDTIAERNALTGLKVSDRVFVTNDGDGKWALYIVTAITDGAGSTSTFVKIADEDIFTNAISASAIKTSYESNENTNAFTDAEKTKLGHVTVTQAVNLDSMESELATTTSTANSALSNANAAGTAAANAQNTANTANTAAAAAQSTANTALADAATAQSTADDALTMANSKEDTFTQVREFFTGIIAAANIPAAITVANTLAAGFVPFVFFNGIAVKTVTFTPGSNQLTYTVPYETETSDTLTVVYAWN